MELELCAVTTSEALRGAENKTITLINLVGICFEMAAYVMLISVWDDVYLLNQMQNFTILQGSRMLAI